MHPAQIERVGQTLKGGVEAQPKQDTAAPANVGVGGALGAQVGGPQRQEEGEESRADQAEPQVQFGVNRQLLQQAG